MATEATRATADGHALASTAEPATASAPSTDTAATNAVVPGGVAGVDSAAAGPVRSSPIAGPAQRGIEPMGSGTGACSPATCTPAGGYMPHQAVAN